MADAAQRYEVISEGFEARLRGLPEGGWELPTPCTEWNVRQIVQHVIEVHEYQLGLLDAVPAAEADPVDPFARWRQLRAAMRAALTDPQRAGTVVRGRGGEKPFADMVDGLFSMDLLTHTWDIARAGGLDERIDVASAERGLALLDTLGDLSRSGMFAPAVPPAPDADVATRFLNRSGRTV